MSWKIIEVKEAIILEQEDLNETEWNVIRKVFNLNSDVQIIRLDLDKFKIYDND